MGGLKSLISELEEETALAHTGITHNDILKHIGIL
jgi:hypothetical protein